MDAYVGTVQSFAFPFAPRGWLLCNGQQLSVVQQTALYSLIGTTYGGDGVRYFNIPNLGGRTVVGMGQSPGVMEPYAVGQQGGAEQRTIRDENLPRHRHVLAATKASADSDTPTADRVLAKASDSSGNPINIYGPAAERIGLAPESIDFAGASQPFPVLQPYMALNYCICLQGVFPSRN
ncbi:phage tail protein [Brevundimonas sp.]|jgi:microcystin-dependent protein|uniref:phage tail protein n=1 Tax=Brevundimonas sp. TaxID=1871086 RepID=UPI002ED8D2DE